MSIIQSNYANTDAEFERILTASLNECIIPNQDITDILLIKSVYLYVSNLLKSIIINQVKLSNGLTSKCISCYVESANVFNICKCGLENLCYSCILTKYVSVLTDKVKLNKESAAPHNKFDKTFIINLLQNTVFCKYCNIPGCFHNSLNILQAADMVKLNNAANIPIYETDFLNMESKTMIDIFPNMYSNHSGTTKQQKADMSSMSMFIRKKNMDALANYGFELKYNHDTQTIIFGLNSEVIKLATAQPPTPIHINTDTIQCNVKLITHAVFNAIYYKCIEFGLENKRKKIIPDKLLLFHWNKYCQTINKLLNLYNITSNSKQLSPFKGECKFDVDETLSSNNQMNYYISVVLLNEITHLKSTTHTETLVSLV